MAGAEICDHADGGDAGENSALDGYGVHIAGARQTSSDFGAWLQPPGIEVGRKDLRFRKVFLIVAYEVS
jgi:hypothetical protein